MLGALVASFDAIPLVLALTQVKMIIDGGQDAEDRGDLKAPSVELAMAIIDLYRSLATELSN